MDDQNKNLILATALSFIVILVWFVLFPPPEPTPADPNAVISAEGDAVLPSVSAGDDADAGVNTAAAQAEGPTQDAPRIAIETGRLKGSISLLGGRIDQLALKDYRVSLDDDAPIVDLLSPVGEKSPYYALYGWAPGAGLAFEQVPGPNTIWSAQSSGNLSVDAPVTLTWDNGNGLQFTRTISVDENFMFSVTQSVENTGAGTVSLAPYGILARHGEPQNLKNFFILHEGVVAMSDGELTEIDYSDMPDFDLTPMRARAPKSPKWPSKAGSVSQTIIG